ncbi:hypothetical protein [Phenylobacterium sp.]|uniref:hypothetical protein n=1 Tax=Phenylobacterium sp. TaxID=1871053 RepID=UPI003D2BDB68
MLAVLAWLLVVSGVAAADLPADKINSFRKGVTTREQVRAELGPPVMERSVPGGRLIDRYDFDVPVSDKVEKAHKLIVLFIFDRKGLLLGADFFANNDAPASGARPATEPLRDENLLTPLEEGFKVAYQARQGQVGISEMTPKDETVEAWSRMVTAHTYFGRRHADPDLIPKGMVKSWAEACPGGTGERIQSGTENGYPMSLWAFRCSHNPQTGKPETMWMKTISGADALYGVQYAYRRAYGEDIAQAAQSFLARVSACDTRDTDHPCPQLTPGR